MRLGAVADAVYAGCSLEPFTDVALTVWFDTDRVVHIDQHCHQSVGTVAAGAVALVETHLHRRCPTCATTAVVPGAVARYGTACEDLARCRGAVEEAVGAHGMTALASATRALSFEADAAGAVAGDERAGTEIERAAVRLRRRAWGLVEAHRPSGRNLVTWVASFAVDPPDGTDRAGFEAARAALRHGDRSALFALLGQPRAREWLDSVTATLECGPWALCEVVFDGSDGALAVALTLDPRIDRHGRTFGSCPDWVRRSAAAIALPVEFYGPVGHGEDRGRPVELFAELARRMPPERAAAAGRRLGRGRPPVAFATDDHSDRTVTFADDTRRCGLDDCGHAGRPADGVEGAAHDTTEGHRVVHHPPVGGR